MASRYVIAKTSGYVDLTFPTGTVRQHIAAGHRYLAAEGGRQAASRTVPALGAWRSHTGPPRPARRHEHIVLAEPQGWSGRQGPGSCCVGTA
jgi:hypothetical protein